MASSFVFNYIWQLSLIAYKNYSKVRKRKCEKQNYLYCDYNDISVTHINFNMTMLRVRIHNDNLPQRFEPKSKTEAPSIYM